MKISGIYKIQSTIKPERIYIGSAVSVSHRWDCHLFNLRHNRHGSVKLQRHYNKYSESDLQFSILLGCDKEDLIKTEQYFIDSYNPWFNIYKIAGSPLGYRHSEEIKRKMSESRKGKYFSEEHKRKIGEASRNRSEETRKKISLANKGRKISEETKRKISQTLTGKHLAEETKKKLSEAHRGKYHSEETKRKQSESHKGENNPNYGKSTWIKGKQHSEETKRKISLARKKYLEKQKELLQINPN